MPTISITRLILLIISASVLTACDWVDSTGNQSTQEDIDSGTATSNVSFESNLELLREGEAQALLENSSSTTQLANDNSSNGIWSWELIAEGENARCDGIDGFDSTIAGNTLLDSCTDPSLCEVRITPASEQGSYTFALPSLAAPVALAYLLRSELVDGTDAEREQVICALSVNEAPTAANDSYRAIAGEPLNVAGTDSDSLLANDSDDIDARNQPLSVDTIVERAPQFASDFRLLSDGGFTYQSRSQLSFGSNGTLNDSFTYRLSDGLHETTATATIVITAANEAPISIGSLPDVRFELSDDETPPPFALDVSPYFDSVDNDTLFYSVSAQSLNELPDSLIVQISENGILDISIDETQTASAVGTWPLEVIASDNLETASSTVVVIVESPTRATNQPPIAEDITNRVVEDNFEYDISGFFTDPDGDELTFSTQQLPQGVTLSTDGVITGRSNNRNEGAWFIRVEAQDGFGGSVSDGFLLTIR